MSADINEILMKCLNAIESSEMTPAECVERYPEHRQQLAVLLHTWETISGAPLVEASPAFRRVAASRLKNRLGTQRPETFSQKIRLIWHSTTHTFSRSFSKRWIAIATIVLLALLGTGAGVAYAADGALPGDPLYSAKTTIEAVRLAFSGPEGDVHLFNEFANTRVAEMQALTAAGRNDDMASAAEGYENAISGLANAMAKLAADDPARAEAHAALLAAAHETRTAKLNELLGKVPEQAQKGIQRALDAGGPPDGKGKPENTGKPENAGCPRKRWWPSGRKGKTR